MSSLLMQGEFAAFFAPLAKTLQDSQPEGKRTGGVEQAIVLQMLQFRLSGPHSTKEINGELWYAGKWTDWEHTFPCWSNRKIRSIFYELRDKSLVKIEERARVNWFTLNYQGLVRAGILSEVALSASSGGTECQGSLSTTKEEQQEGTPIGPQDDSQADQAAAGGQQLALDGNQADGAGDGGSSNSPSTQPRKRNLTRVIWNHYADVMKPRRSEPTPEDLSIINGALKVASADECCRAIDGCAKSDWHMGRDPQTNGRKYNKLSQILKGKRSGKTTREQIDMFLDIAEKAVRDSRVPSADSARIERRKQEVRDRHTMSGDATVVERGQKAEEWLRQLGITVEVRWDQKGGVRRPIVTFHQD